MAETTTGTGFRGAHAGAGQFASSLSTGLDKMLIQVKVRNRLRPAIKTDPDELVPDVTIALIGVQAGTESIPAGPLANKAVTNRKGEAILDLGAMTDGTFTLTVESKYSTTEDVGPSFKPDATADRVFRRLMLTVTARQGIISNAQVFMGWEKNGAVHVTNHGQLLIDLQPVWMKIGHGSRNTYSNPDLIVVHRSGDWAPRSFHIWVNDNIGPHYAIDVDGQIVKLVRDEDAAWHAKGGVWGGKADVNYRSIGIEMINMEPTKYTTEQNASLLGLLQALRKAFPTIPAQAFVGHTDVDVPHYRSEDPGKEFDWESFEKNNLGLVPDSAPIDLVVLYGGFFKAEPIGRLKTGDSDRSRTFGGKVYPKADAKPASPPGPGASAKPAPPKPPAAPKVTINGNPIAELQKDLLGIGYAINETNGEFGPGTKYWVNRFQKHFNSGRRTGFARDGSVDRQTAELIKRVKTYVSRLTP
jgi:N-acetylmuramoyl-L-alanine amidase